MISTNNINNISKENKISYSGDVTFRYMINGKVIDHRTHNSGMPELFKLICQALVGYNITSKIPRCIDLKWENSAENRWESVLTHKIYLTGRHYTESTENELPNVTLTATLVDSDISKEYTSKTSDEDSYELRLTDIDGLDLARIKLNTGELEYIKKGAALIVDWKLIFDNTEDTKS